MCENQKPKDSLAISDEICQNLKKNLQKQCSAASNLEMMTLPFYIRCIQEALLYRSIELAEIAIDLFRRNTIVSAATITRSLLETAALFWRLHEICEKAIKKCVLPDQYDPNFQDLLIAVGRINLGTRDKSVKKYILNSLDPYRVTKMVRDLGTRFRFDANQAYSDLCEVAHPNYRGCMGAFSKWNVQNFRVEFTQDYHHVQENATYFQTLLPLSLQIIKECKEKMAKLLPKFSQMCKKYERRQRNKGNKKNI